RHLLQKILAADEVMVLVVVILQALNLVLGIVAGEGVHREKSAEGVEGSGSLEAIAQLLARAATARISFQPFPIERTALRVSYGGGEAVLVLETSGKSRTVRGIRVMEHRKARDRVVLEARFEARTVDRCQDRVGPPGAVIGIELMGAIWRDGLTEIAKAAR